MHAPYEPCLDLSGVPTCTETLQRGYVISHPICVTCHRQTDTAPNLSMWKQLDKLSDRFTYSILEYKCRLFFYKFC